VTRPATAAVRAGQHQSTADQHSEALVLTSSYTFDDAMDAAEKFAGRRPGNVYVRFTNPTVRGFEERLAAMEGGDDAVATGSGMAAYGAVSMALLKAGDHVLLAEGVFGTTTRFYEHYLQKFGVTTTVLPVDDNARWAAAISPATRMVVVESPTNPMMRVADLRFLARLSHSHGALFMVDNTLCTPVLQQPLALGADLVLHSAGKYIDGQGRCGGGVVTGAATLIEAVRGVLRTAGPSLSPFNAWIFMKSLETLPLRMRAHSEVAAVVSDWLRAQEDVADVYFPGAPDHPQAALIASQQSGPGGLLSFTVPGGRAEAWSFIEHLKMVSNTTNIGDTKTMATHPGSTTHGRLSETQRLAAGITPNLVRLSVGIEDPADILEDLDQALAAVRGRLDRSGAAR
jgi:O-succinylhomoserine sulfhydrylase